MTMNKWTTFPFSKSSISLNQDLLINSPADAHNQNMRDTEIN